MAREIEYDDGALYGGDDDVEQNPIVYAACEICGDVYDKGELVACETCSWLMCESCESEQGNCRDCASELGLLDDDDDDDYDDDDE